MFISRADAASYFERGVEIVDRVGDEMHDRLSAMLGLARAAGAGAEERAEEAVRVARIAEIYEDINNHKFPWLDVVCGVRALGNCAALAIFSRLSSRGTIGLTQTLPALLEPLLEAGSITLQPTPIFTPWAGSGNLSNLAPTS